MVAAIIVAAGKGTRMGPDVDKLFIEIAGCPVVGHTWRTFETCAAVGAIVIVVRPGMQDAFSELGRQFGFTKPFRLVEGGKERQDSVWNGLQALDPACEVVAIQDAARPCTSHAVIQATIAEAQRTGAAVAAQQVVDTIKESKDGVIIGKTLDRAVLWSVQTPQAFSVQLIRRALGEVRRRGILVTDDTAACELIGEQVRLVASAQPNPKITRPEDVPFLELLLKQESECANKAGMV